MNNKVNFADKLALINEHWSPRVIAELNDYQFKLARVQGEFVWHDHPDTDEAFIVLSGSVDIQERGRTVTLNEGELYVVPKGVEHRPVASEECALLLIEPKGVVNTGETGGDLTADLDVWI